MRKPKPVEPTRFVVEQGRQHKSGRRYDLYRDGKKVLSTWSGGKRPPRWLLEWADELNHLKHAVIVLAALLCATPAVASPECMSKQEARAKYQTSHLYWHTENHCWDNRSHRRPIKADPPPKVKPAVKEPVILADASNNTPIRRGRVAQEIIFPPLVARQAAIAADLYAMQRPITEWPLLLDIDVTGPDPDKGIDGCCWPPMESLK